MNRQRKGARTALSASPGISVRADMAVRAPGNGSWKGLTRRSADIVDRERFVGDQKHCDVPIVSRAMFHDLAFREPNECARTVAASVGDQRALDDINGMGTRVRVA